MLLDDAARLLESVVRESKRIGYRRAAQAALQQLGEARHDAGQLAAADDAYVESLGMSEEMGSVTEMAEMLVRIAGLRAKMGDVNEAVSILASVLADPVSSQTTMLSTASINQMATELLAEIGVDLEDGRFATADGTGNPPSIAVTAKELLSAG